MGWRRKHEPGNNLKDNVTLVGIAEGCSKVVLWKFKKPCTERAGHLGDDCELVGIVNVLQRGPTCRRRGLGTNEGKDTETKREKMNDREREYPAFPALQTSSAFPKCQDDSPTAKPATSSHTSATGVISPWTCHLPLLSHHRQRNSQGVRKTIVQLRPRQPTEL